MNPPPDPTGAALFARALLHRDVDEPRLVFADWCDETGDRDLAERFRLQLAIARASTPDTLTIAAAQRQLSGQVVDPEFLRELGTFRVAVEHRRGLPWRIFVRSTHARKPGRWAQLVRVLAARFPTIERALFEGVEGARYDSRAAGDEIALGLGGWPGLAAVGLRHLLPSARGWQALAELPRVARLELAGLIDPDVAAGLRRLQGLEHLRVSQVPRLGAGSWSDVCGASLPALSRLRSLDLVGFGPDAWAPLAGLERLERLSIAEGAHRTDAAAIARLRLRSLVFECVRDTAVAQLPPLDSLTHLGLTVHRGRGRWVRELGKFPRLVSLAFDPVDRATPLGARVARHAGGLVRFSTTARVTSGLVSDLTALPRLAALRLASSHWDEGAIARIGLLAGPRAIDVDPVALEDDRLGRVLAGIRVVSLTVSSGDALRTLTEARLRAIAGHTLEQLVLRGRWRVNAQGRLLRRFLPGLRLLWADELPKDQVGALGAIQGLGVAIGDPAAWGARVAHPDWRAWASLGPDEEVGLVGMSGA